jgi:putative addiction module antidote
MFKKFTKHGNSLAIIIDKPILELLKMHEGTKICMRTDGKSIILEPVDEIQSNVSSDSKMQQYYEEVIEEHEETLKKLAK